jgi:hypothetical protein
MSPRRTEAGSRRSRAFGLALEFDFPAPGLPPLPDGDVVSPDPTRMELADAETIDSGWPAEGAERLITEVFEDPANPERGIDHVPGLGYRLFARGFGLATVSEDGRRIVCAPPELEPWSWQRFLVGRILPWAAVLRGREALHASAVSLDGRTLAFVGESGAGKTSLAIRLHLGGAGLLCDDVLALEASAGGVLAHPGASVFCVRDAERDALGPEAFARLGRLLGHSVKSYIEIQRDEHPPPLAAVYFLRPVSGDADGELVLPEPPDLPLLMSATFNHAVALPARLIAMLDVYTQIAREVPVFSVAVTPALGAAELATVIAEHASGLP